MDTDVNEVIEYGWWDGPECDLVETDEILFAEYDEGGYDGSAYVLFRRDGKLMEVESSHCSCNGLEWDLEETTVAALKLRAEKGSWFYSELDDEVKAVIAAL